MSLVKGCKNCSTKKIDSVDGLAVSGVCSRCSNYSIAYNRYFDSNIPLEYWDLAIPNNQNESADFLGSKDLITLYAKTIQDVDKSYIDGVAFCLAGTHGNGKTTTVANILKKVVQKGYTALYTNLSDIVNALTIAPSEDKYLARKELQEVDFLVCDEMDSRFIPVAENANELFGRTLEIVIRARLQNKQPLILVTNSPNPIESFQSSLKVSLDSLMSKIILIPILGKDIRKEIFI